MSKKKILFQLNYLYHLPAIEPIIHLFANDPDYEVVYQINMDFRYHFGIFRIKVDQSEYKKYFPENVRTLRKKEDFDVVIGTDMIDNSKFNNDHSCVVYHGPTFNKTVTHRELLKHIDEQYIIFAESEFTKGKLLESKSIGRSNIEVVGFPKMDPYLNNNFDKKQILQELKLDGNKKTILYAPTYKPTSIYDLSDKIFEVTKKYNLIIKLHHYSWMGKYANRNQSKIFIDKQKQYSHAVLLPQTGAPRPLHRAGHAPCDGGLAQHVHLEIEVAGVRRRGDLSFKGRLINIAVLPHFPQHIVPAVQQTLFLADRVIV